ncbi:Rv1355c family protein [Nocardia thailandica]
MTEHDIDTEYRAQVLDPADPIDAARLRLLSAAAGIRVRDLRGAMQRELSELVGVPADIDPEDHRWVHYPWRHTLVGVLAEPAYRAIRLDRNRNKLTLDEQRRLASGTIGIVGQSVGHAIAFALAQEGSCGRLRLADFDTLDLSNLNRVPGGLFDIGVNKCVVTARRIAELDPYLPVEIQPTGVDIGSVDEFLDGLTLVIEECDSLDMKFAVREAARRRGLPVFMETSDGGLFDVERYDLEPGRAPFHGVLGATTGADLRGLTTREKAPHVLRILDPDRLSDRMAASLAEIDETVTTWPQLAGDVALGAAVVAAAVRRLGLGRKLSSGRTRVDLDADLDSLAEPVIPDDTVLTVEPADLAPEPEPADPVTAILACAQRAPSGGNVQPWRLDTPSGLVRVTLDPSRTSAMDIGLRGSAVAVGAALYNARAAAAAHGLLGETRFVTGDRAAPLTAELRLGDGTDAALAADYPAALARETSRHLGDARPLPPEAGTVLAAAAAAESANLRVLTAAPDLAAAADLLGDSDRVRYLTPQLHAQLYGELRWPGEDLRTGIDIRSLEPAPDELAEIQVGRRADVMARLRDWQAGRALGDFTADRVKASSALVAVTFATGGGRPDLAGYARAGAAVERVWLAAQRLGLAVQPVSPVFLYAGRREDLRIVSPEFTDTLATIQGHFLDLLGVPVDESVALVLRLSFAAAASVRSRRLPVPGSRTDG